MTTLLRPFRRSRLRASSSLTHRVLPTHTFATPPRNWHDRGIVPATHPAATRQTMGHGYYSTLARPPFAGRTFIRRSWRNDHDAFQGRSGSDHRTTRFRLWCRHHDRRGSHYYRKGRRSLFPVLPNKKYQKIWMSKQHKHQNRINTDQEYIIMWSLIR